MSPNQNLYLDHPLYKFLLPYASTRTQIAGDLIKTSYSKVLDLGCSDGYFLINNSHRFDTGLGLDISSRAISKANKDAATNKLKRFRFKQQDLNRPLRLPAGKFNLVTSLSTIEYLLDPHHFLNEIYKVLRPNGHLIIHTYNLAFIVRRLQLLGGSLPTFNSVPGWQGGIIHNFTWPTFEELLGTHRFQVLDRQTSGLCPPIRLWSRNLLCSDIIIKARKR